MDLYSWLEWLHILSAIVLFGSALAIGWFKWAGDNAEDIRVVHAINERVKAAGWLFTAPTLVLQPLTGILLASLSNRSLGEGWIAGSLALYAGAAVCWILGARMQTRMLAMSAAAAAQSSALPVQYASVAGWWRGLNLAVFAAFFAVLWLMVFKPD